jgi:hypothetical protein
MTRLRTAVAVVTLLLSTPAMVRADVVLDWNEIATGAYIANGQSPFAQARFMAITQLAVFEAVNAITGDYEPYLRTVVAPVGASARAAAIAAAYAVVSHYFPATANLDTAYAASLARIPDGPAKTNGIAAGQAAAAQIIASRVGDGSAPPEFYLPTSDDPGAWQTTVGCPAAGGVNLHWKKITPFGIPSDPSNREGWIRHFRPGPPPALTSRKYAQDYDEVKRVGASTSDSSDRPLDRADVVRFFQASSPTLVANMAARQVAAVQRTSLSYNARALALINMAINDSLVASFGAKYFYNLWRPETAIPAGNTDRNRRTTVDATFTPFIATPCFPSYPSNHASGSYAGGEMLDRLYGDGRHAISLTNPAVPGVTLRYRSFGQITDDVDDARIFGGIHFRFDQEGGARLGRDVAGYIYRHNLGRAKHPWNDRRDHDD